jgi:hypothetical protein
MDVSVPSFIRARLGGAADAVSIVRPLESAAAAAPEEEINCLQPNATAYLSTLNLVNDGNHYLEKAVAENFPDGVLADASTLRVGFMWLFQKY